MAVKQSGLVIVWMRRETHNGLSVTGITEAIISMRPRKRGTRRRFHFNVHSKWEKKEIAIEMNSSLQKNQKIIIILYLLLLEGRTSGIFIHPSSKKPKNAFDKHEDSCGAQLVPACLFSWKRNPKEGVEDVQLLACSERLVSGNRDSRLLLKGLE